MAPTAWFARYAESLTRAGRQAARSQELYRQIVERVSRGDLSPAALPGSLSGFLHTRGAEYTRALSALNAKFFTGLARAGSGRSQGEAEWILPGVAVRDVPPPELDLANPATWVQQVTEYATALNERAVTAFQAHLAGVAAGTITPREVQQAASAYLDRRFLQHLEHIAHLYFDLLDGMTDVRASYEEEYLLGVLGAHLPDHDVPVVLHFAARLGDTTSASLSLANTRAERTVIRCAVTDLRRADGVGPAFVPRIAIAPDELSLDPEQEGIVGLSLRLDASVYAPDAVYVGALHVIRPGEPRLDVPLRITATQGDRDAERHPRSRGLQ